MLNALAQGNYAPDYQTQNYFYIDESIYNAEFGGGDINVMNDLMSLWVFDHFYGVYEMKWIKSPQAPVMKGDLLRIIYDMQKSSNSINHYNKSSKNYIELYLGEPLKELKNMIRILS